MAYSIGQELASLGIVLEVIHHFGFESFASRVTTTTIFFNLMQLALLPWNQAGYSAKPPYISGLVLKLSTSGTEIKDVEHFCLVHDYPYIFVPYNFPHVKYALFWETAIVFAVVVWFLF